ncbi:uncharacterized protein LOC17885727 [Capsella rubella]|uniref:uncharacterized protein LOC17885727 n=1 Tax=Capsella rubella TaxID=81985 RepID=UPI000CD56EF8|nr:uncharacterized protein LOC17885727 [Capsella rubella]
MARVQLFLCFTILFASVTLLDVVSAHLKLKPSLPDQIEAPKTVKDVEPYTVKVVMVFVSDLEKECPKTSKFKAFFAKLRAYAKYVCPIKRKDQVDYDRDMKAKAGGIFQAISSFAIGRIKKEIQEEKQEVIDTFKFMRFVAAKILGSRKKDENEDTMKLTAEQQKEIKEGIIRWETIITRITNTMVMSTKNSSSSETSTTEKGDSSEKSKSSSKDTNSGSPSTGSPSGPKSSDSSEKEAKSKDTKTTGEKSSKDAKNTEDNSSQDTKNTEENSSKDTKNTKENSSKDAKNTEENSSTTSGKETSSKDTKKSAGESSVSQSSAVNVEEVEAETSKQVSTFIMNLEKKCPQKEEYKAFFEQLKGTMVAPPKERKGLFSRLKSAAGKVSGAMAFIRSRIGSKSAEVKKSMEAYQGEVMKTLQELETIHSQIVSQNKGKKEGSLTCTPAQQTQIKQTITKWEQVTTQFVETAVQSETQSSSSTSSSVGKMTSN